MRWTPLVAILLLPLLAAATAAPVPDARGALLIAQADAVPQPRPRPERPPDAPAPQSAPATDPAPKPDGDANAPTDAASGDAAAPETPAAAPEAAQTPAAPPEPPRVYQTACPAVFAGRVEAKTLPPLSEGSCGTQSPLSVTAVMVHGRRVEVNGNVVTDCAMASALPDWLEAVDGYLWAKDNTRITTVNVGGSYICRNRVGGSETEKLSEHGFADALDVTGFTLEDGRSINVTDGWTGGEPLGQSAIRFAHDAACSIFSTTLGPDANAEHHDHLHVDFGCHGKTCTAQLCE